ncbi:MAG: Tyrosine recombinase XerC [Syntrophus sp. SKADARSKE-3]|nr:Tyrosine recombinase XerC [Syntrophus sp. SKADARSKE-3]
MPQYKRKTRFGERWWYKFDLHGKTFYSKAVYKTKNEAKKAEAEKMRDADRPKGEMTFRELCEARMDLIQTKSAHYYLDHKKVLKPIVKEWGSLDIKQIDRLMVSNYLTDMSQRLKRQGKDNYQANKTLRIIKALFFWALDQDLLDRNPVRIKLFPINKKIKYIPPTGDIEKAMAKCNLEQQKLIRFCMDTGARIGEALRVTDKDFNNGTITLFTRKNRRGDLRPRTISYKPDFDVPEGRTFSYWNERPHFLETACKEAKVKLFGFHALRHRKASQLVAEGWDIVRVRDFLGHSDISVTNLYLQSLPGYDFYTEKGKKES